MIVVVLILSIYGVAMTFLFAEARSDLEEERDTRICNDSYHANVIRQMQGDIEAERKSTDLSRKRHHDAIDSWTKLRDRVLAAVEEPVDE